MTRDAVEPPHARLDDLLERARGLAAGGERHILGIAGVPGAGKSWLAAHLTSQLAPHAVHVPMDGFHLSDVALDDLGLRSRKGTLETFDGGGFVALLRRLRAHDEEVVYAPGFERDLEQPIAASIAVRRDVPLVITEGNYLLVDSEPWAQVHDLLDECWFIETAEALRQHRLLSRHVDSGKTPETASAWMARVDDDSARVAAMTRSRADLIGVLS